MRRLKKAILTLLCCRMKRFTALIIVLFFMFIFGNNFYPHPFTGSDGKDRPVTRTSNGPKVNKMIALLIQRRIDKVSVTSYKAGRTEAKITEIKLTLPAVHTFKNGRQQETESNTINVYNTFNDKHKEIKNNIIDTKNVAHIPTRRPTMAVLVISCNRPTVKRCLDGIFKYKPNNVHIPVIVSQDCGDEATAEAIQSYGDKVVHIKQPNLDDVQNVPKHMMRNMGYYKISRHYKWALTETFSRPGIDSVVIVEDDLDIAPDFFEYFLATRPLLDEDPTLFCISAWNDNGKSDLIDENAIDLLYRTDFFPGLGWLITRKIWLEFSTKWPSGFWDDWVRNSEQRKGRSCIRPEISRTRTFGRVGVSLGQFYDQYLKFIKLNEKPYPFREYDLNHLLKENYDKQFLDSVYNTPEHNNNAESMRVTYNNKFDFERIARDYGLMTDFKAGVPRTAYKGIVSIYRNQKRIYIAPNKDWKTYVE